MGAPEGEPHLMVAQVDPWLPGYTHEFVDNGLDWGPGEWKVGLHSTETRKGSAPGIISSWKRNPGLGCSHFIANRPDDIRQLIPFTGAAYTAQNPPGGIDTNRARIVQIEVCEYAINPDMLITPHDPSLGFRVDWSDEWYDALAQWLADLVAHGLDLDLDTELTFGDHWVGYPGGGLAFVASRAVMGHQHIPEQPDRHWDPGELDIHRLLADARRRNGGSPTPTPDPEELTVADIAVLLDAISDLSAKVDQDHIDTRRYIPARAVKVAGDPAQFVIWGNGTRQHLTVPLKQVLVKARTLSDVGREGGVDFVELSDPAEVADFLALPLVG